MENTKLKIVTLKLWFLIRVGKEMIMIIVEMKMIMFLTIKWSGDNSLVLKVKEMKGKHIQMIGEV